MTSNNKRLSLKKCGKNASTEWNSDVLLKDYGDKYVYHAIDIVSMKRSPKYFRPMVKILD